MLATTGISAPQRSKCAPNTQNVPLHPKLIAHTGTCCDGTVGGRDGGAAHPLGEKHDGIARQRHLRVGANCFGSATRDCAVSPRGVRSRSRGKEPSRRFLVDWMQRKAQREQTQRENDRAGLGLYACTWEGCSYAATQPYHLATHYRTHTGERPYKCTWAGCSYAAARQHHLTSHIARRHGTNS